MLTQWYRQTPAELIFARTVDELASEWDAVRFNPFYAPLFADVAPDGPVDRAGAMAFVQRHLLALIRKETDASIQLYLHVFLDHLLLDELATPRRGLVVPYEDALPDVLSEIPKCSFWADDKQKHNKIVHLLSKALPQRCQIRNLREIIYEYCTSDARIFHLIYQFLVCSLLGNYRHAKVRPQVSIRRAILSWYLIENRPEDLKRTLVGSHQQLLFFLIKEFIIYGIALIPSLYAVVRERYEWSRFEEHVIGTMDQVRHQFNTSDVVHPNAWGDMFLETLMSKQQLRNLYRTHRITFSKVIVSECERIDDDACNADVDQAFPRRHVELLEAMSVRVPPDRRVPTEWLEYVGVGPDARAAVDRLQRRYHHDGSKTEVRKFLSSLDRHAFEAVRSLFRIFHDRHRIRFFTLPAHMVEQQERALRARHGLADGAPIPDHVGRVYVCLECNTFRGFVVRPSDACANHYAIGHSKVLVDDDTMKVYCGRKQDKTDNKKRVCANQHSILSLGRITDPALLAQRHRRKIAKDMRKDARFSRCQNTELTKVALRGKIMQLYEQLYLLCPFCANPTHYDPQRYHNDMFSCSRCADRSKGGDEIACTYCAAPMIKDVWEPMRVYNDMRADECRFETIRLCNRCNRSWIRNANQVLRLTTIIQGLACRWKTFRVQSHPSLV